MLKRVALLSILLVAMPLAVIVTPTASAYTPCQTPVAGFNCITPAGWYCMVYAYAVVETVCYRPLAEPASLPVCDPVTNDHWYAGYTIYGPGCTHVDGYVCIQATYNGGGPGGPANDFSCAQEVGFSLP